MHPKRTMKMKNENRYEINFLNENAVGAFAERVDKVTSKWGYSKRDGVGVVSVYGGLYTSDYDLLTAELEILENDEKIESVVIHINSPGGSTAGLFDCCDYIKGMTKKTTAYISGMACSAAYAIATSCNKVYAQQDSETGCCGCFAHVLETTEEAYKRMGFFSRIFRSKNAPKKNLSVSMEEVAEEIQANVDALGDKYLAYVAGNRGVDVAVAEETFGQGAVVSASYALANGMIDGICTIEEAMMADETETTSSSLPEEGEGEDTMDVFAMNAEEQATLFAQLCEANPSLLSERVEEARRAESARVADLNALRNGTEAVDALVDAAVTEGKSASDIALDVIKAMKENPAPTHDETRASALDSLVEATETVAIPVAKSEDQLIEEMVSRL